MAVDGGWRLQAACRGRWQLYDLAPGPGATSAVARLWCHDICAACPVWRDCLIDALATDDEGYRAGTTSQYRRNRRTRSHAAATG